MFRAFLNFDSFVFPKIVTFIYWIGVVLIVLATLASAIGGGAMMGGFGRSGFDFGVFLISLVGGAIGLLAWRVIVELWIVLFSIHDLLRDIRDRKGM